MIDLYTAFKLTKIGDNEIVYLKDKDQPYRGEHKILNGKEVKEQYDMRKTKVIEIGPYFSFEGDYEGMMFTIR